MKTILRKDGLNGSNPTSRDWIYTIQAADYERDNHTRKSSTSGSGLKFLRAFVIRA